MTEFYGFRTSDLDAIKALIEPVLGIAMEARESSYRGGDYYLIKLPNGDQFALQKNYNCVRDDWRFDEYKEMAALLYVSATEAERLEEVSSLMKALSGVYRLERTSLSNENKLETIRFYNGGG